MEINILSEIKKDAKMYEYLHNNSYLYILLNRNPKNIEIFKKKYKDFKNNKRVNDIDNFIDNIDLISTIANLK